jgi:ribulose-phosphate 3-epimerase
LAPSILSADFGRLAEQLRKIESAGAHLVHIDVMDGHFVPNITIGPVVVKYVKKYTNLPLDVHLMIENPQEYIDAFVAAGADIITVHVEAGEMRERVAQIKSTGVAAGAAINPQTSPEILNNVLDELNMVTVMSVNPGFGGQVFIPGSLEKIATVREMIDESGKNIDLEVDGGITCDNALSVIQAGADVLVAGSAVFGGAGIATEVERFLAIQARSGQ